MPRGAARVGGGATFESRNSLTRSLALREVVRRLRDVARRDRAARRLDRGLVVSSELAHMIDVPPGESWRYLASLADGGNTLFVAVCERQPDVWPISYTTHVAAICLVVR